MINKIRYTDIWHNDKETNNDYINQDKNNNSSNIENNNKIIIKIIVTMKQWLKYSEIVIKLTNLINRNGKL